MSTTSKNTGQKNNAKKTRCPRYAVPISKDRADAFVGPLADLLPRATERPSQRAERAFDLQAKGMNQRQIARQLRCSQSTVHRDIEQYRRWFGTTLPEDRGALTGFARFRVALEEHRIFLEHQRGLAMEEWERSRQSVPVKKTRTKIYPKRRKKDGQPVQEVVVEESKKFQAARVSHFNAATKLSLALTMLEGGHLGIRSLSCDKVMDGDELDRWDRAVKSRDATIEELKRKVAELEAKVAQSTPHAPREDVISRSEMNTILESKPVENSPVLNQVPSPAQVATATQPVVCDQPLDSSAAISQAPESMNQDKKSTPHAPREEVISRSEMSTILDPPEEKRPRWCEEMRREALDYHCMIHGIPRLHMEQVSGLPDPKSMTPKQWMERGYPYMIYIDRSQECQRPPERDTRKVITVW